MDVPASALHLQRRAPDENMARFYRLSVEGSLFGDAALVREWGRIGTTGRRRLDLFADVVQAEQAMDRLATAKLRRGYRRVG